MNLSLTRFLNLIRRDFIIHQKALFFGFIGLVAFFAFIIFMGYKTHNVDSTGYWFSWFVTAFFGGGLVLASLIFWEFKSPAGRIQYLSLPASHLEKLLSRQLYSLILYPALIIGLFAILHSVFNSMYDMRTVHDIGKTIKYLVLSFLPAQAFVIVCAVYFNKFTPVKTVIAYWLISVITFIILFLCARVVFADFFTGFTQKKFNVNATMDEGFKDWLENSGTSILQWLGFCIIPIYLWVIAYFKLKEKEV